MLSAVAGDFEHLFAHRDFQFSILTVRKKSLGAYWQMRAGSYCDFVAVLSTGTDYQTKKSPGRITLSGLGWLSPAK